MEISIISQLLVALQSSFLGVILGIIYDLVGLIRILLGVTPKTKLTQRLKEKKIPLQTNPFEKNLCSSKKQAVIFFLTDILYFIIVSLIMMVFIYYVNDGIVRWFIFAGLILGMTVYHFTLGKIVSSLFERCGFCVRVLIEYAKVFINKLFIPISKRVKSILSSIKKSRKIKKKSNSEKSKERIILSVGKRSN